MLILALAGTTFISSIAQAQTSKAVTLDCGGWFSGFAQADNGRLYGYGDVFGAWRSDDGGNNWSYLNWGIPDGDIYGYAMAVQKNNADVVYYSTNNALWKSTDGGTSWTASLTNLGDNTPRFRGASPILIRSNDPNEIWFAGPRKGLTGWLWKSSDGGSNWAKAGGSNFDTNKARTLHNVATFANQIWVGSDNGLYVSTDGGANFNLVGGSGRLIDVGMIQRFTAGTFAGVGVVTRSNNNGGGISRITATDYNNSATYSVTDAATFNLYFGYPTGLQIFSDGSSSAWNTSGDRHGFSPAGDGGQTFSVRATTLNTSVVPIWSSVAEMTAKNHPDYGTDQVIEGVGNPNKWMITGGGAPMYSLDKGLSWQYFPNGNGLAAVKSYLAGVSRFDANRIYIPGSDIGSAIVTDGGASGQAALSSHKSVTGLHGTFRIMEGPDANNLAIAGVDQILNRNILLKSNNGGLTWAESGTGNLPASSEGITKSVMSLTSANDFLVVLAENGTPVQRVYRTTNGGTSFQTVIGLPDNSPTGFRYGPQSCFIERDATQANVRYFVGRGQNLHKSADGGSNWTVITHPFGLNIWVWGLHADPVRSNNLWAAGDYGGVKVSRDGGQTWNSTAQYFNARYVSSCDGKIAIWGKKDNDTNPNLLWYSADDGATWTAQSTVAKNFHWVQGLTVDRNGKIWVSWNSCTVVTPVAGSTIADTQAPSVPTGLSSSNITSTGFTLNWVASTDNVGVTAYEVFRGGVSQGTVTGTSFNATGLTASTAYSMTVRARDAANNNSAQSAAFNVTTSAPAGDTQAPSVPASLSSSNVTQTSFTLNWAASTDNVGVALYEVFRNGISQGTVTGTSFNATGLTSGTAYSMTVRARDAAGNNSAQSSALSVTTAAAAGGSTVLYQAENSTRAGGVVNSTAYANFSGTGYVTNFQKNGASVQFAVNVATAGSYNVRVRYGNAAGPSYPISAYVNGIKITTIQLSSNGSWTTWQDVTQSLSLNAGSNTIRLQKDPQNNGGAYNIDFIAIPATPGAIGSVSDGGLLAKDANIAPDIEIYPNPASNSFNVSVQGDSAKITITSLDGKVMRSISSKEKLTTVDSGNWSAGVYIIKVQSGLQTTIKKVVITK